MGKPEPEGLNAGRTFRFGFSRVDIESDEFAQKITSDLKESAEKIIQRCKLDERAAKRILRNHQQFAEQFIEQVRAKARAEQQG